MFGISAGAAAVIGAGAGLAGSVISSNAAGDAADTQAAATGNAAALTAQSSAATLAENKRQYDLSRSDLEPWRTAGSTALGQLATENNAPVTAADAMADPGYQFGLAQGQQALDRKAAASGGRVSGAALKSATEYGVKYATTGYNAAYQRRQDRLNRLSSLAGIGQTATGASAAAGSSMAESNAETNSNTANALSSLYTSQGNAAAAGQLAQGNIWGNGLNQIASAFKNSGAGSSGSSALSSGWSGTGNNAYYDASGNVIE